MPCHRNVSVFLIIIFILYDLISITPKPYDLCDELNFVCSLIDSNIEFTPTCFYSACLILWRLFIQCTYTEASVANAYINELTIPLSKTLNLKFNSKTSLN